MSHSNENTDASGELAEAEVSANQSNLPPEERHSPQLIDEALVDSYWKANLELLTTLLIIWFLVSFGCGILFVDYLNQFTLFGFKLGFWFAQQGAILCFVVLIFVYTVQMHRLERRYGVDDDSSSSAENSEPNNKNNK